MGWVLTHEKKFSRQILKGRSIPSKGTSTCKGEEASMCLWDKQESGVEEKLSWTEAFVSSLG